MSKLMLFLVILLIFSIVYAAEGDIIPRTSDSSGDSTYTTNDGTALTTNEPPKESTDKNDVFVTGDESKTNEDTGDTTTVPDADTILLNESDTTVTTPDDLNTAGSTLSEDSDTTSPAIGDEAATNPETSVLLDMNDTNTTAQVDANLPTNAKTDSGDTVPADLNDNTRATEGMDETDLQEPSDSTITKPNEPLSLPVPEPEKPKVFSNELVRSFHINTDKARDDEFSFVEQRSKISREAADLTYENVRIEKEVEVYEEKIDGIVEKNSIIKIKILPKKVMRDFRLYEHIPKVIAADASQIIFYEGGYDYYEVIEADPLIVWHFNNVDSDIEVSYGVRKDVSEEELESSFSVPVAEIQSEDAFSPEGTRRTIIFSGIILLGGVFLLGFYELKK
jgi:hypothetical protein